MRRTTLVAGLVVAWFSFATALPASPQGSDQAPTVEQIVMLREIGFNEAQIRAELEPYAGQLELGGEARATLEAAGFSPAFLAFIADLVPAVRLDNAVIAAMLDAGRDEVAIIEVIAAGEAAFDTSIAGMLALQDGRTVPVAVTKAMLGAPLTNEDLRQLAAAGTPAEAQILLVDLLGHEVVLGDAGAALALAQSGVPAEVLQALRRATPPAVAASSAEAVDAPADLERFTHVTRLFSLVYPRNWFFERYLDGDATIYQATPSRPRSDSEPALGADTLAFTARYWLRDTTSEGAGTSPTDVLDAGLARFYGGRLEGVVPTGEPTALEIDGRAAAFRDYSATVDGEAVALRWYIVVGHDHYVGLLAHASPSELETALPRLAALAEATEVPGSPFPERREANFAENELAARYAKSVVAVMASDDGRTFPASGSGFFIRADGYLLTNDHVIFNEAEGRPWRYFRIRWSNDLGLDDEDAELVARVRTDSRIEAGLINTGEDMALLRVSGVGPYDAIPLSPLERTQVGDPIITIGFPITTRFDARVSTTISSGSVSRFNRDAEDRIETIITDAKIAPGNSGGPAVSLVTGGVVGLNTTIAPQSFAASDDRGTRESIGYAGIMPIDRAIQYFPQQTIVTAERDQEIDATDAYDLAVFAFQKGWRTGAIGLAARAVDRAPASAAARHISARVLLTEHPDRTDDDLIDGARELDRALALDPSFQEALFTKADFEIEREEYLEAIKAVNTAIEERENWVALSKRASIYATMDQEEDALTALERAKPLGGGVAPDPYILAGDILYELERHEEGLTEFREATRIAPTNVAARLGVGRYFLNTEKYLAALLEFDAVRESDPKEPDVHAAIGQTYARQGNYGRAVDSFYEAMARYVEAERVPPEAVLVEAAETAADKLLDQDAGRYFYTRYLGLYYDSRGTLPGHRYLAGQFPDDGAIRRAHLARAVELKGNAQDDERRELEDKLEPIRNLRLELADLRTLRAQRYPSSLVVRMILDNPATFTLAGATNADGSLTEDRERALTELAEEFGVDIAYAIYLKVRGIEEGNEPRQQQAERNEVPLIGTWVRDQGTRRAEIDLNEDLSYRIDEVVGGRRETRSEGQWRYSTEAKALVLSFSQNGRERSVSLPLRVSAGATEADDRMFLTQDGQEQEYRRGRG